MLRAAADGELDAEEQDALETHLARHPDDRSVIAFERRLRDELERSFAATAAPLDLEVRLRQRVSVASRPRSGRWTKLLAAAAVLIALAIGLRLGSGSIDEESGFAGRGDLVRFLATHPGDCRISPERTLEAYHVRDMGGAVGELGRILGRQPTLGDLDRTELEFLGMERCGVPGDQVSMHLLFRGAEDSVLEGEIVSVYVQPSDGRLPLADGVAHRLVPRTAQYAGLEIVAWRRNGLDYIVCSPEAAATELVLASAGAPPVTQLL